MTDRTYNGWTNYATWRVNLELFDGMTARDITGHGLPAVSELRDALQEHAESIIDDTTDEGIGRNYALAFLSDVNWWEIANSMIAGADGDDDEGDEE